MSLGLSLKKKNTPYLLLLGMYVLLTVLISLAMMSLSSPAAAASGFFCNNNQEYPAAAGQSGVTPEEWCADKGGLRTGGSGIVCVNGSEVPGDAGVTPEQFCSDKGGVRAASNTGSGSNASSSGAPKECNITDFNAGSKGCVVDVEVIDEGNAHGKYQCGNGGKEVMITFNIGCRGVDNEGDVSAMEDMFFSLLRFLSAGIGVAVVGSIIVSGIQYSASQGNPQAMQAAIKRIQASVAALLLYAFGFAFLNWIVPGGILI